MQHSLFVIWLQGVIQLQGCEDDEIGHLPDNNNVIRLIIFTQTRSSHERRISDICLRSKIFLDDKTVKETDTMPIVTQVLFPVSTFAMPLHMIIKRH